MENCANISEGERLEKLCHQHQKYFSFSDHIFKWIRQVFYGLIIVLTTQERIKVWSCCDRAGNTYWNAYDPISNQVLERATELEMRRWLEKRYNQ